jgi:ABC-2 type transport system ATP-binding protein
MIQFSNYKKYYQHSALVLEIPDLQLPQGMYWLQGENGSGKTTLFKSIAALIPYQGQILLDQVDGQKHPMTYRKQVTYAEAEPLYPSFLSGQEMANFVLETKGPGFLALPELIEFLGTSKYMHQPVSTYSAGMLKKLSLLLAFMGKPKLIMLDEPLITLDVQSVEAVQQLIKRFYSEGASFLITSHQKFSEQSALEMKMLRLEHKTLIVA